MKLLSIETSCDETAAAVTQDGRKILSNVVASQTELHLKYGGVVPEIASRAHIERINPVIREALEKAGVTPADIDAVAVVNAPGLIGSLMVGVTAAKTLAWAWGKPLIAVDHIHAHVYSCAMNEDGPPVTWPAVALVVSGGHTALYHCTDELNRRMLGNTLDDAAGEAFDKVAAILGLGYPGGPVVDRLAEIGSPTAYDFPRSLMHGDSLDFSFSGLKTAVLYTVRGQPGVVRSGSIHRPHTGESLSAAGPTFVFGGESVALTDQQKADLCASFQAAVVDVLVGKTLRAAERTGARDILVGGGVSANSGLRAAMIAAGQRTGRRVHFPAKALCTDNAAMLAVAYHKFLRGDFAGLDLQASAG
jgi:N6-L-threonylcarbamoyladenine synthase